MTKAKQIPLSERLFFDRMLLVALVLTATAYIFRDSYLEPLLTIGAVFTSVLWSYRTAIMYPNRNVRLGAAMVFALIAMVSVYYLARLQGGI